MFLKILTTKQSSIGFTKCKSFLFVQNRPHEDHPFFLFPAPSLIEIVSRFLFLKIFLLIKVGLFDCHFFGFYILQLHRLIKVGLFDCHFFGFYILQLHSYCTPHCWRLVIFFFEDMVESSCSILFVFCRLLNIWQYIFLRDG
ncbi:uncharacterized protein LOC113308179 [Papaver somniferum]|uniref:uncharacterized protein LOC113308179 n=1 Tax=Papaver somniferum TaxID=3469 RepID=UPI000E6F8A9E|nr:uncharacterized protein LOC113308179 [Papaver somniferum]